MTVIERRLPNGYVVGLLPRTEVIVDEIWGRRCYDAPIGEGDWVVDLGANQGIYSLYAAAQGARVIAVEPDEGNFRRLVDNVERNGLAGRITCHRAAIAALDGTVDLFAPETDAYCDSGLITTEESMRRSYAALAPRQVRRVAVPAMTLETLLSRIAGERIAVLKIDCEGAELAILQSAGRAQHARIRHLVMETHAAYPERDLFFAVQDLGYAVTAYRKRARGVAPAFATGHLSAQRGPAAGSEFGGVVAVLEAPRKAMAGVPVTATAEQSFTASSRQARLEFRWTLDGAPLGDDHAVHFAPERPGDHLLTLEVADPATGRTDSVEHHLWFALPEHGRPPEQLVALRTPSERLGTRFVPGGTWYGVLGDRLPVQHRAGLWQPDLLSLEVTLLDPETEDFDVVVQLEDRTVRIQGAYTRIDLAHYPLGEDLVFRVEASRPVDAELRWFPDLAGGERRLERSGGRHDLPERSRTYVCPLAARTGFRIPPSAMPSDWIPERIKLGVSVHPSDAAGGPLEGEVEVEGERRRLAGGYAELVLARPPAFLGGVAFEVRVGKPRVYKLVWWWE